LNVSLLGEPSTAGQSGTHSGNGSALSGDVDRDRELIRSLLEASSKSRKQIERQLEYGDLGCVQPRMKKIALAKPAAASDKSDGTLREILPRCLKLAVQVSRPQT
jgi:hypothetical protein